MTKLISLPQGYSVEVGEGTITIFRSGINGSPNGTTFKEGDQAEYDSFNLRYLGTITKITEKTVTIVAYKGRPNIERTRRLKLHEFAWRNHNFDLARVQAENAETSMCI